MDREEMNGSNRDRTANAHDENETPESNTPSDPALTSSQDQPAATVQNEPDHVMATVNPFGPRPTATTTQSANAPCSGRLAGTTHAATSSRADDALVDLPLRPRLVAATNPFASASGSGNASGTRPLARINPFGSGPRPAATTDPFGSGSGSRLMATTNPFGARPATRQNVPLILNAGGYNAPQPNAGPRNPLAEAFSEQIAARQLAIAQIGWWNGGVEVNYNRLHPRPRDFHAFADDGDLDAWFLQQDLPRYVPPPPSYDSLPSPYDGRLLGDSGPGWLRIQARSVEWEEDMSNDRHEECNRLVAESFALYRALLRRSQQVLPSASAKVFAERTKDVFRINAKARSHAAIRTALEDGYKLSEPSNPPDTSLQATRKQQPSSVTSDTQSNTLNHRPIDTGRRWPHPAARPVLDGLPPPPPGKTRRVPTLVNANHIPFIRFKKPQSPFLSHIIRQKNVEREKRVDRMQALEKQLDVAEDEDQWDKLLRDLHQVSNDDNGTTWASATREALKDVKRVHQTNTIKRMHIARRMFDILQEQRKLADEERLERRNRRHEAYKARRRAVEQVNTGEEDQPAASAAAV
ncbi:MAG: hypothetical protein Q9210_006985 [Variospora velana]